MNENQKAGVEAVKRFAEAKAHPEKLIEQIRAQQNEIDNLLVRIAGIEQKYGEVLVENGKFYRELESARLEIARLKRVVGPGVCPPGSPG